MLLHFVIFCFAKCWNYEYRPPPPKWIIENPFTFDSYKGGMCISLEIVCIFSFCMQTAFRSPTFWQIDFVSVPTCYANDTHIKNDLHKFHSIWIETIICNRIRNLYRNTSAQISFNTLNLLVSHWNVSDSLSLFDSRASFFQIVQDSVRFCKFISSSFKSKLISQYHLLLMYQSLRTPWSKVYFDLTGFIWHLESSAKFLLVFQEI